MRAAQAGECIGRASNAKWERAHTVMDGPTRGGMELRRVCCLQPLRRTQVRVSPRSGPFHLCPVQGLNDCARGKRHRAVTVRAGRDPAGGRDAPWRVRQEGPGRIRLGRARNGEAGPTAGGVRATGGAGRRRQ